MFLITKPSRSAIQSFLDGQQHHGLSYPEVGATDGSLPPRYTVDHNRVLLGKGRPVFDAAKASLREWRMFKLGWVEVFPEKPVIAVGETVSIAVSHFGFWSLNACRIVYVINEERRFGFAYGTVEDHAEQGEERFSTEWLEDDSVWFDILAFSRPRQWQARLARPLSRRLQKKFARDAMAAMKGESQ
jgi:uncharacterized protein (UPF0548 family)